MEYIQTFIEGAVLVYFAYVVFYTLILSISGLFKIKYSYEGIKKKNHIAILVPAYKEDGVIVSSANKLLEQNYDRKFYKIVVIGDQLKRSTIDLLKSLPIELIEVQFERSTKVKSLNEAMSVIGDAFDLAIVMDADNLLEEDFVSKMNDCYNAGYVSIQAQRKAKNSNTNMSVLDGISEDINNHIYRKGTFVLGGSSAIVGSGFAVKYDLLKNTLAKMDSIGGFDKELEIKLLQSGVKTAYLEHAVLYDEKVEQVNTFANQRKRWIASQYFYLRKYFKVGVRALLNGNFALFNSAVLRYIQLPRLLNIGLLSGFAILSYFLRNYLTLPFYMWTVLLLLLSLSMILSVPRKTYNLKLLRAALLLPKTFAIMMLLMFKLKKANNSFIHTPHSGSNN